MRWPVAPLIEKSRAGNVRTFSEWYGISTTQLRNKRGLSTLCADRYAVKAGFLPSEVWPDWYERLNRERRAEAVFEVMRCAERFVSVAANDTRVVRSVSQKEARPGTALTVTPAPRHRQHPGTREQR